MDLEQHIQNLFKTQHKTLGLAESCTGGAIASRLTKQSGASNYLKGGIVAYTIELKERLLNVPPNIIQQHGVVSEQVAIYMAQGALKALNCDVALAITGIAGPTGGTKDTPVGTIWVGLASELNQNKAIKLQLSGSRVSIIEQATIQCLQLILDFIKG